MNPPSSDDIIEISTHSNDFIKIVFPPLERYDRLVDLNHQILTALYPHLSKDLNQIQYMSDSESDDEFGDYDYINSKGKSYTKVFIIYYIEILFEFVYSSILYYFIIKG